LCDGASPSCPTSCEDDDDCEQSAFCDVTDSVCKPDQPEGSACSASAQCATGHCVDEVCCDGPCSGTCQACAASLKASASDDGICGDAESGRDPHEDCTEESGGCGQDGQCDGSGACRLRVRGTSCGTGAMCVENLTVGQVCDGLGECTDEPDGIGCSPYRCPVGGAGCSIPCATDDDCTPDAFCDGGECRVRSSPGATCVADAECQTGFCTDGVCCARACEDQCEACDLAGAEGACAPVASDGDCAEGQHCADQGDGSMRCVESQVDCEAQGTCPPGPSPTADDDAGCGCRAAGRRQEGVASALLAALALAMLVGRRRRDY
jgi:MYXO-CTERM domain-containing protein